MVNSSHGITFPFGQILLEKVGIVSSLKLLVQQYHCSSSIRMALALNNSQRLIFPLNKINLPRKEYYSQMHPVLNLKGVWSHLFIAITLRSTLTWSGIFHYIPLYSTDRSV